MTTPSQVSFAASDYSEGAVPSWTLEVTPSALAALLDGDTIDVHFPAPWNPTIDDFDISLISGFDASASVIGASTVGQTVTITLGATVTALLGSTKGTIQFATVLTNPTAAVYAASGFTIATSKDTTPRANATDITITGAASAPTVTTQAASNVTATGAKLNGLIANTNGGNTVGSFKWGTDPGLAGGVFQAAVPASVPDPGINQGVYTILEGLTLGTTYYFALYGQNSGGNTLGTILSFVPAVQRTPPSMTLLGVG